MTIPNFNLRLKDEELQKLQESVKYEVYNNNLVIKENCFVLNAIQEQIDSQYDQFKEFPSKNITFLVKFITTTKQLCIKLKFKQGKTKKLNLTVYIKKQVKSLQIQKFTQKLRNRTNNCCNCTCFLKTSDLNILKQAVQQGLSMIEDMKSVGVAQISFMLGYEQTVFQKMVLEYILGYSKSKKQAIFQVSYNLHKNKLQKIQSLQTLGSQKQKKIFRKLGSNNLKKSDPILPQQPKEANIKETKDKQKNSSQNDLSFHNMSSINNNFRQNSFSNTSYHSYSEGRNLVGFDRQRVGNNSQSIINLSRRSINPETGLNMNDISEIRSGNSDTSEIKNIRIRSFKSKDSNVSDYF